MKKLVLLTILVFGNKIEICAQGNTMYPIADHYVNIWDINNTNLNIMYPGNLYLGSSQGSMIGGGSFTVEGSSEVDIKAKAINFKNTHLGSTDPNFKVHVNTKSMAVASNYVATGSIPMVPLYEKIEYGIELPEEIQSKINLFLNSNTSAANPNHPGLNPYDPQDISVEATITGVINDINMAPGVDLDFNTTVYGFYYQEASPSADMMSWNVNNATPYPFRIRFAPPWLGEYTITFKITYWNNGGYQIINLSGVSMFPGSNGGTIGFLFNGVANSSGKAIAKGYLEVGQHKRHLRHKYDKTSFFPIGMNIPQPICSTNPCSEPLRNPQGMANRRYEFSQLAANGGNYTRILSFGDRENGTNCVEITHRRSWDPYNLIGNYQINQDKMMETDLDIQTFENNSIFATWCLQTYGFDDIPNTNDYYASWSTNPYKYELNKNQVTEFFTDSDCQRFFKNKLRYIQARWGYSASIAIYQLNSEIDDFGRSKTGTPPNEVWTNPYRTNATYAQKGEQWQTTMASHIKSFYPNHLISSSYVANPTQTVTQGQAEFPIVCHDKFIYNNNCDIVSWNPYQDDKPTNGVGTEVLNRKRFTWVHEIAFDIGSLIADCNPNIFRFCDKPIFFSECGMNDGYNIDPFTDIQMHNMIWATACSGMAGVGLPWQGWEAYTSGSQIEKKFKNFRAIANFFNGIDFENNKYVPAVFHAWQLIDPNGDIDNTDDQSPDSMKIEIFTMQNDKSSTSEASDRGFGWLHHRDGFWPRRLTPVPYQDTVENITKFNFIPNANPSDILLQDRTHDYKLNGFKIGNYLIDIFSTGGTGALIGSSSDNDDIHSNLINTLKLNVPLISLVAHDGVEFLDYGFKFFHASVNGNDLRTENSNLESNQTESNLSTTENQKFIIEPLLFELELTPNPTRNDVIIKSTIQLMQSISILDITGNLIFYENGLNTNLKSLYLSNLSPGVYILEVISMNGIRKKNKIIKL